MTNSVTFGTAGPHTPEQTIQWAHAAAELIRCLNYATMPGAGGIECPQDVYLVVGYLLSAAERMEQLLDQLADRLGEQSETGRLGDDRGTDPAAAVEDASMSLECASADLAPLVDWLRRVHNATSHLLVKEDTSA